MLGTILGKIFGTKDIREIKKLKADVDKINSLEDSFSSLSDEQLKLKTKEFKDRLSKGESLDSILHEAFATVREASKRVLGMRHFDVQLLGGIVLHQGKIAEMRTGEGKTLVATCPVYLNALTGRGVHVVTVNDYLAKRDKEWMAKVYEFLGLSVGVILSGMSPSERKEAYASDIVYGTNNEFGFDYLRDNMTQKRDEIVQREFNYAIVDEVDSILIDEARTPLIISGSAKDVMKVYELFANVVKQLSKDKHYKVDEKENSVLLEEEGITKVENILKIDNLYSAENVEMTHYLNQALRAKELFKRDKDYIVRDSKVIIVDEFTGRLMDGRRYSEGLHQSIEAKEKVTIASENQTLATITLQNYFRMYNKLAGMTGTAKTEEGEFTLIYDLKVVSIPTNRPIMRRDHSDLVYLSEFEKLESIADKIEEINKKGQPILVGTASIDSSEVISKMLKKRRVPHNVLNAKQHEREADIVAQAGRIGSVTIATNMAGRGTDIILGGNPEFLAKRRADENDDKYDEVLMKLIKECSEEKQKVLELGGLFILGTERHESRRIDNQLRGRAGRQGDPGESLFYLSLDDDLMRMFGSERVAELMKKMGYSEKEPIQHKMINRSIENAQKRVEARNFGVRKQLLEYDDVVNKQREVIYKQRSEIMNLDNVDDKLISIIDRVVSHAVNLYSNEEKINVDAFLNYFKEKFSLELTKEDNVREKMREIILDKLKDRDKIKRTTMLHVIDGRWRENLANLDSLREGIHLRSYGQQDPIVQYKISASQLYYDMASHIREEILTFLFKMEL